MYLDGKITRESGTSASSPVFAAMVTLWNDMRLTYGKPPMGFIAPFLYAAWAAHPEAFNDIVTGDNACGVGHNTEDTLCCAESFAAVPGWDAVTGLGSPNFGVLSNLVINADSAFPALGSFPNGSPSSDSGEPSPDDELSVVAISALTVSLASLCLACFGVYQAFLYDKLVKQRKSSLYASLHSDA